MRPASRLPFGKKPLDRFAEIPGVSPGGVISSSVRQLPIVMSWRKQIDRLLPPLAKTIVYDEGKRHNASGIERRLPVWVNLTICRSDV